MKNNKLAKLDYQINDALCGIANETLKTYAEEFVTKAMITNTFSVKEILNALLVWMNAVSMGGDCGRLQLFQYLGTQFRLYNYTDTQQHFILDALQRYFQPLADATPCNMYMAVTDYLRNMPSVNIRTNQIRETVKTVLCEQLDALPSLIEQLEPKDKANLIVKMAALVIPKSQALNTNIPNNDGVKRQYFDI